MNITPNNLVELLKTASETIMELTNQVQEVETLKEAMSLVEPLTRRGIVLEGKSFAEKTENLLKRADFNELRVIIKAPVAFSLGEVSKEAHASKNRDALDKLVFGDF